MSDEPQHEASGAPDVVWARQAPGIDDVGGIWMASKVPLDDAGYTKYLRLDSPVLVELVRAAGAIGKLHEELRGSGKHIVSPPWVKDKLRALYDACPRLRAALRTFEEVRDGLPPKAAEGGE